MKINFAAFIKLCEICTLLHSSRHAGKSQAGKRRWKFAADRLRWAPLGGRCNRLLLFAAPGTVFFAYVSFANAHSRTAAFFIFPFKCNIGIYRAGNKREMAPNGGRVVRIRGLDTRITVVRPASIGAVNTSCAAAGSLLFSCSTFDLAVRIRCQIDTKVIQQHHGNHCNVFKTTIQRMV